VRFSECFKLDSTQPHLDFVDIRLDTDIAVFMDPSAIKASTSTFGHECASFVQNYFEAVLQRIKAGKDAEAQRLVSCLNERNEFHLGYSQNKSRGHAFGTISAAAVWGALSKSQASVTGLLKDLEDTCLLIEGIGRDMISDAVCNILRGPLIRYTQHMCQYYDVPLTPAVDSGPIWPGPLTRRIYYKRAKIQAAKRQGSFASTMDDRRRLRWRWWQLSVVWIGRQSRDE
jgi:hypothetical protein